MDTPNPTTPNSNTLALAKQGNPNAIAALINRSFASRGIRVVRVSITEGLLEIELQTQNPPIAPDILERVKVGAKKLQIPTVNRIKVSEVNTALDASKEADSNTVLEDKPQDNTNKSSTAPEAQGAPVQADQKTPHYSKMATAPSHPAAKQSNVLSTTMAFVGSGGLVIIVTLIALTGIFSLTNHWANSRNREQVTVPVDVPPSLETADDTQTPREDNQPPASTINSNSPASSALPVALPTSVNVLTGIQTFRGESDVFEVSNQPGLNFGTDDFSMSAWVKTNRQSGIEIIVDKRVETSGPIQGYVLANYQGSLLLQLADAGSKDGWSNYINDGFIADGQWHHVAVTVDRDAPDGLRWYLNGREVGARANPTGRSGSLDNTQPLVVGQRSDHPSWPSAFNGEMADIKLFNTLLTAQQIASLAGNPSF